MRSKMTREERVKEREKLKEAKSMFYSGRGGGAKKIAFCFPTYSPYFFSHKLKQLRDKSLLT